VAAALQEGEEAKGLPDAAQGDVQGVVIRRKVEEPVQAGVQQFQALQQGGLVGLVLAAAVQGQPPGQILLMAAEGRGGKLELPRQGAVGHRGQQAPVNLRLGGVGTHRTAFYHNCAPKLEFPPAAGWLTGYQERRREARTGRTGGRITGGMNIFRYPWYIWIFCDPGIGVRFGKVSGSYGEACQIPKKKLYIRLNG